MVSLDNLCINHIGDEGRDGGHVLAIEELVEPAHPSLCNQYDRTRREIAGMDTGTPLEEKIVEDNSWVYGDSSRGTVVCYFIRSNFCWRAAMSE